MSNEKQMHTLSSLRKAASAHNRDVRVNKMVKVSQNKSALMSEMQKKLVRMPQSSPSQKRGRKRKLQAPRAPGRPKRKKGTSAMFKTTKTGQVKVRKSAGVKRTLAF